MNAVCLSLYRAWQYALAVTGISPNANIASFAAFFNDLTLFRITISNVIGNVNVRLRVKASFVLLCNATFFKTGSGEPLRHFLQNNATLKKVVDFGDLQVFEGVMTYPEILIF